ncbi:MAG TPA: AAA domain-containing protein [Mycobacteriales bacterium]|nr:AAA domain-containing protein [Mycobacteriales bacterium]
MQEAVDQELAAAETGGRRAAFGVDATRVARGPAGCLYRVDPPPEATLVEDAPARLSAGDRASEGQLGSVADESCLVEVADDLGPRLLDGRLVVDNLGPLHGLRQRLTALEGPVPATFRFDQAELVLGAPGGRLKDAIAAAADETGEWSFDDRAGDVLRSALRHRWAQVQTPPGTDSGALVARLLDRLLALQARVLFTAPTGQAVDRTVGALCERLTRSGRLRSGLVQRVGPVAPGAVRDRYGPFVDAVTIAADLRAGVDARLADLDKVESRLKYDELDQQAAELDRYAADLDSRLERAVGSRSGRRDRGLDPDTLVIRRHELRTQGRSARKDADRIAQELAAGEGPLPTVEDVVGAGGTPAEQRRRLAAARRELIAARDEVAPALRGRVRLVAATTRGAYLRGLPRADFDVVVIAGVALPPEAYYLAGLSGRSVIAVGDAGLGRSPEPYTRRPPHPEELPRRRRPGLGRTGRVHRVRPDDRP